MPKILLVALAALFATQFAFAENLSIKPCPGRNLDRHAAICKAVKEMPEAKLVFVGDSITQQWGGTPELKRGAYGLATWNKHYARHNALNLGVSSDRTENILWRLRNGALDGLSPKVFVLLAGTNNFMVYKTTPAASAEDTVSGVDAIVTLLKEKSPKSQVIVVGVLPRNFKGKDTPEQIALPGKVNALLAKKYNSAKGISYMDMTPRVTDPSGAPKKELFYDGLHLNSAGYEVWASELNPLLAKFL